MGYANGLRVASAVLALCTAPAFAGYELYNKDDTKLDFNLTTAAVGFEDPDSWFGQSKQFLGAKTDSWAEFGIEPGLAFEMPLGSGTFFSQVSAVYTNTYKDDASGLTIGPEGRSPAATTLEQANIGYKVSDLFQGLDNDVLTMELGRFDYSVGTGMIINDGGSDGGHRGGWYLGMRKAFQQSALVSLKSDELVAEVFHLKNNPRHGGPQGEANGANFEYTFVGQLTLGATYSRVNPQGGADDANVWDGRATWKTPLKGFSVSGEYAKESSNDIDAAGYYGQVQYEMEDAAWKPAFTYRYAHFDGDKLGTTKSERFNELAYGYTDYGYWFQGEIAGNYPLGNGNTETHMLRAKMAPTEKLTLNLIYYKILLDQPESFAEGVTSDDFGDEVDFTADWAATDHLYFIGVLGLLAPGNAAKQWTGGNDDWKYLMLYVSYTL